MKPIFENQPKRSFQPFERSLQEYHKQKRGQSKKRKYQSITNLGNNLFFHSIDLSIPSPLEIQSWGSREILSGEVVGEVTNWETVNYKTLNPEPGGLFCQKIFGPVVDYTCACGKKTTYGECEKCGVQHTPARIRRHQLGYIKLQQPIVHTLYASQKPSPIKAFLGWPQRRIHSVIYGVEFCYLPKKQYRFKPLVRHQLDVSLESTRHNNRVLNGKTPETTQKQMSPFYSYQSRPTPKLFQTQQQQKLKTHWKNIRKSYYIRSALHASRHRYGVAFDATWREMDTFFNYLTYSWEQPKDTDITIPYYSSSLLLGSKTTFALNSIPESAQPYPLYTGGVVFQKLLSYARPATLLLNSKFIITKLETQAHNIYYQNPNSYFLIAGKHIKKKYAKRYQTNEIRNTFCHLYTYLHFCKKICELPRPLNVHVMRQLLHRRQRYSLPTAQRWSGLLLRLFLKPYAFMTTQALPNRVFLRRIFSRKRYALSLATTTNEFVDKFSKRQEYFRDFYLARTAPAWMVLNFLPVIPPGLRPILSIGGELFVSDLNNLYRKILTRNKRLQNSTPVELYDSAFLGNWEAWCYNIRQLQEAVDSLFKTAALESERPVKSLLDILKGKKGRFRQNLLGKRVDYSGRSVIVVEPKLKIHECGIPKQMALELFHPFLVQKLGHLKKNIGLAKELISQQHPIIWPLLKKICRNTPVLLNRAPTLHRLGIQAFFPKLVEGQAILLHPLVCPAFNADFDGDQMAVHVPLSPLAQAEAITLLWSRHHLLAPASGQPLLLPTQDMVLGCYYLTTLHPRPKTIKSKKRGSPGFYFGTAQEVYTLYHRKELSLHQNIWVRFFTPVQTLDAEQQAKTKELPVEYRITPFGLCEHVFRNKVQIGQLQNTCEHRIYQNKVSQFIRTTTGRILFHTHLHEFIN